MTTSSIFYLHDLYLGGFERLSGGVTRLSPTADGRPRLRWFEHGDRSGPRGDQVLVEVSPKGEVLDTRLVRATKTSFRPCATMVLAEVLDV